MSRSDLRGLALALALALSSSLLIGSAELRAAPERAPERPEAATDTAITYQGQLSQAGRPAQGSFDFEVRLYDSASGGSQIGDTLQLDGVPIQSGVFSLGLDFGPGAFDGSPRHLAIAVRPGGGSGAYTPLAPRQALSPAPLALALPGLRTQPGAGSPNLIGGHRDNAAAAGLSGVSIGGGGAAASEANRAASDFASIGGGHSNVVYGRLGVIGGGGHNATQAEASTIAGGWDNAANGYGAVVGGGANNRASGDRTTIAGGASNIASAERASIGGGGFNRVTASHGSIAGGALITVTGAFGSVGGGQHNQVAGPGGHVGGGALNQIGGDDGSFGTIGGGQANAILAPHATIGGGGFNIASGYAATVGGGGGDPQYYTLLPGDPGIRIMASNTAEGAWSTIAGGGSNWAQGPGASVGGGESNKARGAYATIGGGEANQAAGEHSTVPGGEGNRASGSWSLAAGRNARATHAGSFVWADSQAAEMPSRGADQFVVRAKGGLWFGDRAIPDVAFLDWGLITTSTDAYLSWGGVWTNASDAALKRDFASVDGRDLLDRLAALPIQTWRYRSESPAIRHIGPTAQDFQAAFALSSDDRHIGTVDADGVALAAAQTLYALSLAQAARIDALEADHRTLETRVSGLEARLARLESGTASPAAPGPSAPPRGDLAAIGLAALLGLAFSLRPRRPGGA
ncbi:MAG: tail fiber domain-containing protein [Chloroflexi bacterium]|nr:tail fiber domain-containing protein [Chloroflexota bacterium]